MSRANSWPAEALSLMEKFQIQYGVPAEASQDFFRLMCNTLVAQARAANDEQVIEDGQALYASGAAHTEIEARHNNLRNGSLALKQFAGQVAELPVVSFPEAAPVLEIARSLPIVMAASTELVLHSAQAA
jgi:hypothetical protein